MRICIATRTPFVSGGETALLQLARGLERVGESVVVVCPEGADVWRYLDGQGVKVRGCRVELTDRRRPWRFWNSVRNLRRILNREKADVAHANDLASIQALGRAAAKEGIPAICHVRQVVAGGAAAWFCKYGFDCAIAVSEYLGRHLVDAAPSVFAGRTVVSWDGLAIGSRANEEERRAAREVLGISADAVGFVFVGQVTEVKGVRDYIDAVSLLRGAVRRKVCCAVVGDDVRGGGAYRRRMMDRAEEKGVADSVGFLGFRSDVERWLTASDCVVVPSLVDPLGMTVMEAMARGRAVIGTEVGGIPEMVVSGETGLLVPPASPEALAEAMTRMACDPGLAERMGMRGYERAKALFSIERHVAEVLEVYRKVLSAHRSDGKAGDGG